MPSEEPAMPSEPSAPSGKQLPESREDDSAGEKREPPGDPEVFFEADNAELTKLLDGLSLAPDEKVNQLYDFLVARIERCRVLKDDSFAGSRRHEEAIKERDRNRAEQAKVTQAKVKLEASCKDLQRQKESIVQENKRITEEEQTRHEELQEKFQQTIADVQQKMDAEVKVREHFLNENAELRGKFAKFMEMYEAQEKQLEEQRIAHEEHMERAQNRLQEHEVMSREAKVKGVATAKKNEGLRKSEGALRSQLQSVLGRFDDFHKAVTGSNERHSEYKVEIDVLQARLTELGEENAELRKSTSATETAKEREKAQKQRDALFKLCESLRKDKDGLREELEEMKRAADAC